MLMALPFYKPIVRISETFHLPLLFPVASRGPRLALLCMSLWKFPVDKVEDGLTQTPFIAPFVHELMPHCLIVYVAD